MCVCVCVRGVCVCAAVHRQEEQDCRTLESRAAQQRPLYGRADCSTPLLFTCRTSAGEPPRRRAGPNVSPDTSALSHIDLRTVDTASLLFKDGVPKSPN